MGSPTDYLLDVSRFVCLFLGEGGGLKHHMVERLRKEISDTML